MVRLVVPLGKAGLQTITRIDSGAEIDQTIRDGGRTKETPTRSKRTTSISRDRDMNGITNVLDSLAILATEFLSVAEGRGMEW